MMFPLQIQPGYSFLEGQSSEQTPPSITHPDGGVAF
jgi:hypothetical protein